MSVTTIQQESVASLELELSRSHRAIRAKLRNTLRIQLLLTYTKELSMGIFTKDIKTMDDLFFHQLEDIYYAE